MRTFVFVGLVSFGLYLGYREYLRRQAVGRDIIHLPGAPEATPEEVEAVSEALEPWTLNLQRDFMG